MAAPLNPPRQRGKTLSAHPRPFAVPTCKRGNISRRIPRRFASATAAAASEPYVPLEHRNHPSLSDDDAAVLSVLLAHPGRHAPFDLAAAAWGADAGNRIVDLAETIARLQEWLEPQPETLEAVEADGTLWYRLLIPHSGPGTESSP